MTGRRSSRRWGALAAVLAAVVALTGCEGAYDLPLPGGAARGDDVYRVTIEFADVLDLVPQSAVKVDDVTVGAVENIKLDGWQARVTVRLENGVTLPDNAEARLRQTSLLGEKFVSLSPPADDEAAVGDLSDGDLIPLDRTSRGSEVEEVLGALSLLLNGGGVAQLQLINRELNDAMEGRESDVQGLITQLDVFVTGLDEQKDEIVRTLEAVDRLSATLAAQQDDISTALDTIPGGLQVLADQREDLTAMLTALSDLGVTATRVIDASQENTVASLQALDPVLTQLAASGSDLANSLELLLTYPFPDNATDGIRGNYTNLNVNLQVSAADLTGLLPPPSAEGPAPPAPPVPPLPTIPSLPPLPPVVADLCEQLGQLPVNCDLPPLTEICADLGLPVGCDVADGLCTELGLDEGCDLPPLEELCQQTPILGDTLCPSGPAPPGGGGGGGGGICIPLLTCSRVPDALAQGTYDDELARLLLGGVSS